MNSSNDVGGCSSGRPRLSATDVAGVLRDRYGLRVLPLNSDKAVDHDSTRASSSHTNSASGGDVRQRQLQNSSPTCVLDVRKLDSYDDQNFLCTVVPLYSEDGPVTRVVVKVYNLLALGVKMDQAVDRGGVLRLSSLVAARDILVMQDTVLAALKENNVCAPLVIRPIASSKNSSNFSGAAYPSAAVAATAAAGATPIVQLGDGVTEPLQRHFVRVLSFIDGPLLSDVKDPSRSLIRAVGTQLARLDLCIGQLHLPPARQRDNLEWDLRHALSTLDRLKRLRVLDHLNESKADAISAWIGYYKKHVLPELDSVPWSNVHGDANDQNIVVTRDHASIAAFIDFGDMVYTHRVNDVAICVAYMMLEKAGERRIQTAADIVVAYTGTLALTPTEVDLVLPLAMMRLCVSVCYSSHAFAQEPDNEYLLVTARPGWAILTGLLDTYGSPEAVHQAYRRLVSTDLKPSSLSTPAAVATNPM